MRGLRVILVIIIIRIMHLPYLAIRSCKVRWLLVGLAEAVWRRRARRT